MVQRTNAGGISRMGRATQGVRVMNCKSDDRVSAVALVVESSAEVEAQTDGAGPQGADGRSDAESSGDGKPAGTAKAAKRTTKRRRS
jgi:hypothetical protein